MIFKSKAEGGKLLKDAQQRLKVARRTGTKQEIDLATKLIKKIQKAIDDLDEKKYNRSNR